MCNVMWHWKGRAARDGFSTGMWPRETQGQACFCGAAEAQLAKRRKMGWWEPCERLQTEREAVLDEMFKQASDGTSDAHDRRASRAWRSCVKLRLLSVDVQVRSFGANMKAVWKRLANLHLRPIFVMFKVWRSGRSTIWLQHSVLLLCGWLPSLTNTRNHLERVAGPANSAS